MHVIVLAPMAETGQHWQYAVEDLGADWRCTPCTAPEEALPLLEGADVLLLLPGSAGAELLALLEMRPPLAPPYLLGGPDGPLCPAEALPEVMASWRAQGRLPVMHTRYMQQVEQMAEALLRAMDIPRRLRAWTFLPHMLALIVVHPPLRQGLQQHLYPLVAAGCGMSAAGVERSLRLCIESTWTHGSLPALERFFGMRVDPEKGKPTNAAFLRRVSELLTEGMQRLLQH